jgi:hypothetical protein
MARPSATKPVEAPEALHPSEQESLQDLPPERALALIGMGLMRKLAASAQDGPWLWNESEDGGAIDVQGLRQRLEMVELALRTAAPLTTAEVTHLMGARPGSAVVERGGLLARRQSRNVWILSRSQAEGGDPGGHFQETPRRRF